MISRRIAFAFVLCCLQTSFVTAQSRISRSDAEAIRQSVRSLLGPMYRVSSFLKDSTTTETSIFFTAYSKGLSFEYEPRWLLGVFKNGGVFWRSDTMLLPPGATGERVISIMDLNGDQQSEILVSIYMGVKQEKEQLWIFSWDGMIGGIINETRENESTLASYRGLFEFVDLNGDGVIEIRGGLEGDTEDEVVPVTYTWNGLEFGKWDNAPQPLPGGYLPRSFLKAIVNVMVNRNSDGLEYRFSLVNSATSKQEVDEFLIFGYTNNVIRSTGRDKWKFALRHKSLLGWGNLLLYANYIGKGQNDTTFSIVSTGLPFIGRFFVRGATNSLMNPEFEVESWYQDLLANSVSGLTLGPADPPSPFIHAAFLDTLLSYTRQSAELGWLAPSTGLGRDRDNDCDNDERPEDGIVRNIEQRLKKAKRELERRDSVLARRELEKLVSKVERLWKRSQPARPESGGEDDKKDKRDRWEKRDKVVMTSEAYALLKYNTEYLIDRLPDRKPKKGSKDKD